MAPRTHLSLAQKKQFKNHKLQNPKLTQEDLCQWTWKTFGCQVGRSTMSKIISEDLPETLTPDAKRHQKGRFPAMEEELYKLVLDTQAKTALTDFVLYTKANQLLAASGVTASVSLSWVSRFKTRHGIRSYRLHGEVGTVDVADLNKQRQELQTLIEQYEPQNVFNMDETGLFFRMLPSRALATMPISGKDKSRISIGLCANMDGSEKMNPVVINKHLNPRCFKGCNVSKIPIHYYANSKAWMTAVVFTDWLKSFNLKMCGRKVLLLVDNAPTHVDLELSNVLVKFLPPNTTAYIQPMDAGIIRNFKLKYKTHFVQWLLDQLSVGNEDKKLDVLSAVHMVVRAWSEVTPSTIRHCWAHTGIVPAPTVCILRQDDEPTKPLDLTSLASLMQKLSLSDSMDAEEYLTCDDNMDEWGPEAEISVSTDECHEDDDDIDESENTPMTHREALNAVVELATYTFVHNIDAPGLHKLTESVRQQLLGSMRQQRITDFSLQ
ncbi:hypothetical protein LEN26_020242 [Aphanomyces euteiches]|nr:hypothetical protein LEN26_020242 [Aphanomyces euteiches]